MPARLYAHLPGSTEPLVLQRPTPRSPWSLTGAPPDLVRTGPGSFSVIVDRVSHHVQVVKADRTQGHYRLRIGPHMITVRLEDEHAHLVHALGLDKAAKTAAREVKAPMPGLVLQVLVGEGATVVKDQPVLVLEAMKMENVIKSPGEATVTKVHVGERMAVEKGQLLVSFS